MQQKQHAIDWFMNMVEKGAMNPLNPDLSLVPMDILLEFYKGTDPKGKIIPSWTAVDVSNFLLLACLEVLEQQKGQGKPREIIIKVSDVRMAMNQLLILVNLEMLRRKGLLNYHTYGGWHNGKCEILISALNYDAIGSSISHLLELPSCN